MTEHEDVAIIKFGRELTKEEKKELETYAYSIDSACIDVEWSKEEIQ